MCAETTVPATASVCKDTGAPSRCKERHLPGTLRSVCPRTIHPAGVPPATLPWWCAPMVGWCARVKSKQNSPYQQSGRASNQVPCAAISCCFRPPTP